jgi:uncharacterized membrane protein YhaH (DUF805 family)
MFINGLGRNVHSLIVKKLITIHISNWYALSFIVDFYLLVSHIPISLRYHPAQVNIVINLFRDRYTSLYLCNKKYLY